MNTGHYILFILVSGLVGGMVVTSGNLLFGLGTIGGIVIFLLLMILNVLDERLKR